MTDANTLPDDPAQLKQIIAQLRARNTYLEEQFRLAQQKQFGQSSEGYPGQGELFNEAEEIAVQPVNNADKQQISYERSKPKRKPLPKDLPREVIVHDIADEDKTCDCCGGELHKIGEDKAEKLEFIPAQIKVIEHVRPKYRCRACEQTGTQVQIKQAPAPKSPIPKGIATPSLLSQIITSKYQYGLPLHRQEAMFNQYGIDLSRKTMSDWMLKCAELFKPIYNRLHELILQQAVVQADETTVKVVNEDKSTCYMWLYCSGTDSPVPNRNIPNIVLYDYQRSRSGSCAVNFLGGYSNYLQVDGYAGYEQTQATLVGCWAHARRKFVEADKAQAKGKTGKAAWAINHIQKLYRIEQLIKDKSPAEKLAARKQQALPLLEQFKQWLDKASQHALKKTKQAEAVTYCLNQWHKLMRYTENGHLNIDNNRAERAIKPFVIGRKNWLFSNTATGANASAMLYSLIETAKANDLTPFDYLNHILKELSPHHKITSVEHLLPWNENVAQLKTAD